jgi:hypothetical protein
MESAVCCTVVSGRLARRVVGKIAQCIEKSRNRHRQAGVVVQFVEQFLKISEPLRPVFAAAKRGILIPLLLIQILASNLGNGRHADALPDIGGAVI